MRIRTTLALAVGTMALSGCDSGSGPGSGAGVVASVPVTTYPSACASSATVPQPSVTIPNTGMTLSPLGRLTRVGNLPFGGAVTPDGGQYWAVDSGFGLDDVQVVDIASGAVVQTLPLPGAYGAMVFAPNALAAYVSGEPLGSGNAVPPSGLQGTSGDVIHVFTRSSVATPWSEQTPIALPSTTGGSGRSNSLPPSSNAPAWPVGIAITPDAKTLVVALNSADKAAVISLSGGSNATVSTGTYPYGAAIERSGKFAYVTSELDGTLTKIALTSSNATTTIRGLGGAGGDYNSHPQNVIADPNADRLYVTVTNRDAVAVIDTTNDSIVKLISLARAEGPGAAPVALALSPNSDTLYVADAGENAIVAVALTDRASGAKTYDVLGKIPTADYPHDVQVTPDGCSLVWTSMRGLGTGPNPGYKFWSFGPPSAYPSYLPTMLIGQVGVLPRPADRYFAQARSGVEAATIPGDGSGTKPVAPSDTPLVAAGGGASDKIKYVFYVVKENRTYDQIFGSDPRGNGDPSLELFDDNGVARPIGGITPNAHALSRQFVLFDNFYEDSEVSVDGHIVTSSAYATDYVLKGIHANYANRGKPYDFGVYPVTYPPKAFLFDAMVRHSPQITFRNYGEGAAGIVEAGNERQDSYQTVVANTDTSYPSVILIGCTATAQGAPNSPQCVFDSDQSTTAPAAQSRMNIFKTEFAQQLAAGTVPQFNYLVMTSDHTQGVSNSGRDPLAMVADNDLGLGELVDLISHSSIWSQSVIFVVEDDSQDGIDHVDAHRAPAYVIGPYVKHGGAVIHTHYDQYSVIRTIELILGLSPLSMHDANALPMYDVFTATANSASYTFIPPTQNVLAMCPCTADTQLAALSAVLPWDRLDAVPQELNDRMLWLRVHGPGAKVPAPGPNGSPEEHERAMKALRLYARYRQQPARAREVLSTYLASADD